LKSKDIPDVRTWRLTAVDFDDFKLDGDEMVLAAVAMWDDLDLSRTFCVDRTVSLGLPRAPIYSQFYPLKFEPSDSFLFVF
jgi:hypothetical protein